MRAIVWRGGAEFAAEEHPDPEAGPGETVVKVDTAAVCGTDVHITQGLFPATPPRILGHEFSGTIVAVGPGVSPERIGQQVACDHTSHCGECANCREWQVGRCLHGVPSSGAYAEYAVVPDQSAHRLP
ncbi:MAG: alcohol dehydrogenase catalytic domain-containing protein, partial [Gemmatimonadetes bacterium]|nr:alcohol dehydrogenase catalytic domain-containing protein [Gemmatimonadota bacterium]